MSKKSRSPSPLSPVVHNRNHPHLMLWILMTAVEKNSFTRQNLFHSSFLRLGASFVVSLFLSCFFYYFIIFLLIEMALLWKHVSQSLSPNECTSILLLDFHLLHAVLCTIYIFLIMTTSTCTKSHVQMYVQGEGNFYVIWRNKGMIPQL